MTSEQSNKTYEVGFSTEKMQHIFYITCPDDVDAKTFAHAVFHYYDTPAEWGVKRGITAIAVINSKSCVPDFLHIELQEKHELAMPEENEASHGIVKQMVQKIMSDGWIPMAIYDDERKVMNVYATNRLEIDPQVGATSVVRNFSLFGGAVGR